MTVGKDVSGLFPDVLKCIQTDDLELKKLVYLYLMNYAQNLPELAILAINTFCKDTEDRNPLIRALALRTMGCIRVERMLDYLLEPLRRTLKDEHAYVRKTAAICVAKVFEMSPSVAEENGLIEQLQKMLADTNPLVLSNVVMGLQDIQNKMPSEPVFVIDARIARKLLSALNECMEWGQTTILDALGRYTPSSEEEAEYGIEQVLPRLQHANASVVLAAIKVILLYVECLGEEHPLKRQVPRKLAPPLVSLLSGPAELQYVALRNTNLIIQKYRDIFANGVRIFFCRYNDPLYVKLEKLQLIYLLTEAGNAEQVVMELLEYAKEVEVPFVKRAMHILAQVAIKIPSMAGRILEAFDELLETEQPLIVQRIAIAVQLIYRNRSYRTDLIVHLCAHVDILWTDNESKVALLWMIGAYAVPDSLQILEHLCKNFALEASLIQSELLTSTFRCYLRDPSLYIRLMKQAIEMAQRETMEIHDRAVMYSRLLELDPSLARELMDFEEHYEQARDRADPNLDELIANLGSIASIYHRLVASSSSESRDMIDSSMVSSPRAKKEEPMLLDLEGMEISSDQPSQKQSQTVDYSVFDLLGD